MGFTADIINVNQIVLFQRTRHSIHGFLNIHTAVKRTDRNIPVVLIHFNNGTFGWIKALQAIHSQGRYMSVDFTQGDMAAVAKAFGASFCLSFWIG
ncbi:MAG: thiamine pyrophosphate-dependent enzyme [Desulfobacterium sp.]